MRWLLDGLHDLCGNIGTLPTPHEHGMLEADIIAVTGRHDTRIGAQKLMTGRVCGIHC